MFTFHHHVIDTTLHILNILRVHVYTAVKSKLMPFGHFQLFYLELMQAAGRMQNYVHTSNSAFSRYSYIANKLKVFLIVHARLFHKSIYINKNLKRE